MATAALRWFQAAILLQIVLLAYGLAIDTVDLSPWNDLAARPGDYDLAQRVALYALPQLGLMFLFALGVRIGAMAAALGYGSYLAVQLWTWWKPVVWLSDTDWPARYAELYADTVKLVPPDLLALAPDAQHIALQALTLATLLVTLMAISRMRYL
jgi:hypothetical protein